MLKYAVIGSGYRSEFFGRIARAVADPWKPVQSERMPWHRTVPMTQFSDPY